VKAVMISSFFDPPKATAAAKALIGEKINFLFAVMDEPSFLQVANDEGVWAGSWNTDVRQFGHARCRLGMEHIPLDRRIRLRLQHRTDDAETDHLCTEVRPVDAERLRDFGERSAAALRDFLRDHGCYCTRNSA